jgi:GH15 family glucan-1,4-alpha-glucosidase
MDGAFGDEEWPNFQLDGFGTFLWGMAEHLEPESLTTGSTSSSEAPAPTSESHQVRQSGSGWYEAAELIATYLTHLWRTPNFDCWEEFSNQVHVSTLCAIYGGLSRAGRCFGREEWRAKADEIKNFVREQCAGSGCLTKFIASDTVDSSLLWAAVPFNMFDARESLMVGTIQQVQTDLVGPDGGVHRYAADSYYGGGLWILLTAALGEDLLAQGNLTAARSMLAWIEGQAWDDGTLPEQVPEDLIVPEQFEPWLQERGPISGCVGRSWA